MSVIFFVKLTSVKSKTFHDLEILFHKLRNVSVSLCNSDKESCQMISIPGIIHYCVNSFPSGFISETRNMAGKAVQ